MRQNASVNLVARLRTVEGKGIVKRRAWPTHFLFLDLFMSSGASTPSGSDSKRQRVLPVPKAAASMRAFEPDSSIVSDIIPSPNYGERNKARQPDMIVLHYTGMPDVEGALARLCTAGTEVSAHYVVLEDGRIVQCVPEARRAWHAGVSSWA